MPPPLSDSVLHCTSCGLRAVTKAADLARLLDHGRAQKQHGSGSFERTAEYVTTECDDCMRKSLNAPELRAVGYEMARIFSHVQQQVGRGVPMDEAIRRAVAERTIRDEVALSVPFVTWLRERDDLPDDFKAWAETATAEEPTAVATDTSKRPASIIAQAILPLTLCPLCGAPGVARIDNLTHKCLTGCGEWFEVVE